jgi:hypothetical protein
MTGWVAWAAEGMRCLRAVGGFKAWRASCWLEELGMARVGERELDEINVVAVAVLGQGEADLGLGLELRLG